MDALAAALDASPLADDNSPLDLIQLIVSAKAWASDLFNRFLDEASRIAVYHSSTECQRYAMDAADTAAVTIETCAGMPETLLRQQLTQVERGLVLRGPHRDTWLELKLAWQHPSALQAVLSMPQAASCAVTKLKVQLRHHGAKAEPGVHTPWLQALPAAFPNLRTLHISHLCGCLPHPDHLPHLTELQVHLAPTVSWHLWEVCDSVAPYLAQLEALRVTRETEDYESDDESADETAAMPWARVFTGACPRLRRFGTTEPLTDELLRLLLARAPGVTHLQCDLSRGGLSSEHASKTWAVESIGVESDHVLELWRLPKSPSQLYIAPVRPRTLRVEFLPWDPAALAQWVQREQPGAVALQGTWFFELQSPPGLAPEAQPAALRLMLQACNRICCVLGRDGAARQAILRRFSLTPALMRELSGLPTYDVPVQLHLAACDWPPEAVRAMQQLPSIVPACYGTWNLSFIVQRSLHPHIRPYTSEHFKGLCTGSAVCERSKLLLRVASLHVGLQDYEIPADERALVDSYVREQGLSERVIFDWNW